MLCLFSEIMAADRQLAEEIEFDLKRFEEEQKRIAKPQTPLSATPHAQMVCFEVFVLNSFPSVFQ